MKVNTETTKTERLCTIVGSVLIIAGVVTIVFIGAFYGYHHMTVWAAGVLFVVSGILISKSVALANFLNDILRF